MHTCKQSIEKQRINYEKSRKIETALKLATGRCPASLKLKARTSVICANLLVEEINSLATSEECLVKVLPCLAKAMMVGLELVGENTVPLLCQVC